MSGNLISKSIVILLGILFGLFLMIIIFEPLLSGNQISNGMGACAEKYEGCDILKCEYEIAGEYVMFLGERYTHCLLEELRGELREDGT